MLRKYNRNIPLPLPAHRTIDRVLSTPPVIDLRKSGGPIKDQGEEGSCTGHAFTSAGEWIFRHWHAKAPIFSPQYFYSRELIMQGSFPTDAGSDGTTGAHVAIQYGFCEESIYPYISGQIERPTAEQNANAHQWTVGAFHGLANSKVAISVLGDMIPWPVQIGFTVYKSFESEETAKTGVMKMPAFTEEVLGGHEVLALGYDVGDKPTLRPSDAPPSVLIQNSWGTAWGLSGYFWMPVEYLDRPDTDMKVIHTGRPW